jgi:hypothetical protein
VLARQALYCLSHTSSFFCSGYYEIGSQFLPRLAWTEVLLFVLPAVPGVAVELHSAQQLVEMGSSELFAQAGLKL